MERDMFIVNAYQAAKVASLKGAPISPPIAAAQAALESAFGKSQLAREGNNLFGVKAGASWQGQTLSLPTKEWSPERGWYETTAVWRKYPNWEESFDDYGDMIGRLSWYADAVAVCDDPLAYLKALVNRDEPVYATDPAYIEKVWAIVEQYGLLEPQHPQLRGHHPDTNDYLGNISVVGDKGYPAWLKGQETLRSAARNVIKVAGGCQADIYDHTPSSLRHAVIELERALER